MNTSLSLSGKTTVCSGAYLRSLKTLPTNGNLASSKNKVAIELIKDIADARKLFGEKKLNK